MSDDNKTDTQNTPTDGATQPNPAIDPAMIPLVMHAQYIKDLSFENPNAPGSLLPGQSIPGTTVNVTLDSRKLEEMPGENTAYEVLLHIEASATRKEDGKDAKVVFLVELDYAAVCSINKEVPERHHHPILMIEVPKLIFPFARQILGEVTSQAGYPPLLLNPVDFEGMYRREYEAQQRAAAAGA